MMFGIVSLATDGRFSMHLFPDGSFSVVLSDLDGKPLASQDFVPTDLKELAILVNNVVNTQKDILKD